jgi:hypothetical protein
MFGFGTRRTPAVIDRSRVVGLDLTATRARAVALAAGRTRTLVLDDPHENLPLFLNLDRRAPEVGRVGYALCRKLPHLACSNFLPQLGQPRQWHAGRVTVTPETALLTTFDALRGPVAAETDAAGLSLPTYLTAMQVKSLIELANKSRLPVRGTIAAPLALVAHRVAGRLEEPATIIVVDADEFALSAAVIGVEPHEVKLLGHASWPPASLKAWKDRLLDTIADRCVRLCRRDPRDSAEAEQALYEQLEPALDRTRLGQPVTLSVRSAHWYQDLVHQADDFEAFCATLAKQGGEGVRELVRSAKLALPPRAVWLTHAAARLPGLANAIHQNLPEQTEVLALPPNAIADATATLVPFWLTGMLPRVHLDVAVPFHHSPLSRETNSSAEALPPSKS